MLNNFVGTIMFTEINEQLANLTLNITGPKLIYKHFLFDPSSLRQHPVFFLFGLQKLN